MDIWDFLTRFAWLTLIGTLISLVIVAVTSIGGLYLFWPRIPIPKS